MNAHTETHRDANTQPQTDMKIYTHTDTYTELYYRCTDIDTDTQRYVYRKTH